jgi:probable HAF family extracellular repeat protein
VLLKSGEKTTDQGGVEREALMTRTWICALGLAAVACSGGDPHPAASFRGLGSLEGEVGQSAAIGISGDGRVVVGWSRGATSGTQAFRWSSDGMRALAGPRDGESSVAHDASSDGSVIVGHVRSDSTRVEAFRWTAASGIVGLGDLPGGRFDSKARAVSADGSVVVGTSDSASGLEAFQWTRSAGMVGLGDLPGGRFQSQANAVSADGAVVVGSSLSRSGVEAFRWTRTGIVGLGDLPGGRPPSAFKSRAYAVSSDGGVVVGSGTTPVGEESFRWSPDGGMALLGHIDGGAVHAVWAWLEGTPLRRISAGRGYSFSVAHGVTPGGARVVGWTAWPRSVGSATSLDSEATLWDSQQGMRRLRDALEELGLDLDGWTLTSARAISDDGRSIVGTGRSPSGRKEGWIATLP